MVPEKSCCESRSSWAGGDSAATQAPRVPQGRLERCLMLSLVTVALWSPSGTTQASWP